VTLPVPIDRPELRTKGEPAGGASFLEAAAEEGIAEPAVEGALVAFDGLGGNRKERQAYYERLEETA
jgi:hypothetical protein